MATQMKEIHERDIRGSIVQGLWDMVDDVLVRKIAALLSQNGFVSFSLFFVVFRCFSFNIFLVDLLVDILIAMSCNIFEYLFIVCQSIFLVRFSVGGGVWPQSGWCVGALSFASCFAVVGPRTVRTSSFTFIVGTFNFVWRATFC
jgi:hypothetical protein